MRVYLASPVTQQQADYVRDMPVLLSFGCYAPTLDRYAQSFGRILIDSGAYSEYTTGKAIDLGAYAAWCERWYPQADAVAGLDDIRGDWRRSLKNYEAFPQGFPTFHETDPRELLDDLAAMGLERGGWIGLGLLPETRQRRKGHDWLRETLRRIPDGLHVHGWAMRGYTNHRRLDSVDSTNWWRDAMDVAKKLPWLTYGEAMDVVVKRYVREARMVAGAASETTLPLFAGEDDAA